MQITDIISLFAIIISVLSMVYIREHDDNIRFLNLFNEIYNKTFLLRVKLNQITKSLWNIPFYYEYDSIIASDDIEESVLDYLTELENFFSFVRKHQLSKKSLQTLMSFAFYQRIASLYAYILKKRIKINNPAMFQNYIKTVRSIRKMKKIKKQITSSNNKCYIGVRESDVFYTPQYFNKTICIFSNLPDQEPFSIRHNQNISHREIFPFYIDRVQQLLNDKTTSFYFYNQRTAYNFDETIRQKCKCINSKEVLDFINNKLTLSKTVFL